MGLIGAGNNPAPPFQRTLQKGIVADLIKNALDRGISVERFYLRFYR